jgi:hypothetical protein
VNYSKAGISTNDHIIPANPKKEKDDALCAKSPTNVHFFLMRYDTEGNIVPIHGRLACEACGKPIKQNGARWVLDRFIISEADDIEDLL